MKSYFTPNVNYNIIKFQIENYTEKMLSKERKKLFKVEPLTLIEYVQTSIEILMQLKSEEARNAEKISNSDI